MNVPVVGFWKINGNGIMNKKQLIVMRVCIVLIVVLGFGTRGEEFFRLSIMAAAITAGLIIHFKDKTPKNRQ